MKNEPIRVLLVEDSPTDALIVQAELAQPADGQFSMVHVEQLKEALSRLRAEFFDVMLVDLSLPDSQGFETFVRLHAAAPATPLVVLSAHADKNLAIKAVQAGAQDYLEKGHLCEGVLPRSIGYAIERQRAATDLRATHAQLRQVLEHSPAVIYALKVQEKRVAPYVVSENIIAFLGFTVAESLRPEWWLGQLHPEDRDRAVASISETLTHDTSLTEYRIRHRNGNYCWVEDSRRLSRDSVGRPVEIVGVWADITERKRAEEVLREAAQQKVARQKAQMTRELVVAIAIGILALVVLYFTNPLRSSIRNLALRHLDNLADAVSMLVVVSFGFVAISSRRRREFRDQASDQFHVQEALRILHGELEVRVQQRTMELAKTNESLRGEIVRHQRSEQALRESDEKFRQIAASITEAFWITDSSMNQIHYISPVYERIWGRTCASLYESPRSWLEAVHPDDHVRILTAVETKFARGDFDETYRIIRPEGTERWIHARAFPLRNPAGEIHRVVGTAEDISERRQLESQMRQSQKMEAFGQLASGVAHDFNNVLAVIIGHGALAMTDTGPDHPSYESLKQIEKAATRAKHLVQQILTFSRQQAQARHVIGLAPIIQEAVAFLRSTIPAAVELVTSIAPNAPAVFADSTQMHQVVVNLCTNAWHALEDQPGRINVELQSVNLDAEMANQLAGLRPGRFACLSIGDTGKGMDAPTLKRIFEPFFTTKEVGRGTGLGLSVVHGIVQEHEGAIHVTSQPGKGSIFQVYLPAAASPMDVPTAPVTKVQPGGGQRVLYLDDEEPIVFLATRMLERLGFRVAGFTHAADAVKAFDENPGQFDVVITDLNMPGMSGLRVADAILKRRPSVPIVLCSGHISEALRQQAQALGIRELLYKPSTMQEFSQAIHRSISETPPSPS